MKKRNLLFAQSGAFLLALAVCLPLFGQQNSFSLMGKEHRQENDKWYIYSEGRITAEIIPRRIIVRLSDKGMMEDFDFDRFNIKETSVFSRRFLDGFYILWVGDHGEPFKVAGQLEDTGLFDVIEFDGYGENTGTPDDPQYTNQWNLKSNKLDMENAWNITTGNNDIILAIIDEGVMFSHEDLVDNVWQNLGEDADGDGKTLEFSGGQWILDPGDLDNDDDDGNGFDDDLIGWDFIDDDNTIPAETHGTRVAGVAAARTNNSIGVAGIAGGWNNQKGISLMILRDLAAGSSPSAGDMAMAIDYAVDNGADVINMSQVISAPFQVLQTAVNDATTSPNDVVIVASGGNSGGPTSSQRVIDWPARYANAIAVGSTDQNDARWTTNLKQGSQIGDMDNEIYLDIMAPGPDGSIWTTQSNGSYVSAFGKTSAAAPQVSGVAALIRSINSNLNWRDVRTILRNTADKVSGMNGANYTDEYGYGRINAYEALKYTLENYGGTLSGNVTLTEDLTIQSGNTLTIDPGTTIKFDSGVKLTINGALDVNGTSPSQVTFTRSGATGDWDGITFNANSSGNINYAVIDYVSNSDGINILSASPTIQNTTIRNCLWGLNLNTSNAIIQNCTLDNNDEGVFDRYGAAQYLVNTIKNSFGALTDGVGLNFSNTDPVLFDNVIEDNVTGVYGTGTTYAQFGGIDQTGNNVIRSNNLGLYSSGAYMWLGEDGEFGGDNSVYSNAGLDALGLSGGWIIAENTWWGSASGGNVSGNVIDDYPLSSDPNSGMAPAREGELQVALNPAEGEVVDDAILDLLKQRRLINDIYYSLATTIRIPY